jgi:hypothetical protein
MRSGNIKPLYRCFFVGRYNEAEKIGYTMRQFAALPAQFAVFVVTLHGAYNISNFFWLSTSTPNVPKATFLLTFTGLPKNWKQR